MLRVDQYSPYTLAFYTDYVSVDAHATRSSACGINKSDKICEWQALVVRLNFYVILFQDNFAIHTACIFRKP